MPPPPNAPAGAAGQPSSAAGPGPATAAAAPPPSGPPASQGSAGRVDFQNMFRDPPSQSTAAPPPASATGVYPSQSLVDLFKSDSPPSSAAAPNSASAPNTASARTVRCPRATHTCRIRRALTRPQASLTPRRPVSPPMAQRLLDRRPLPRLRPQTPIRGLPAVSTRSSRWSIFSKAMAARSERVVRAKQRRAVAGFIAPCARLKATRRRYE